MGRSSGCATAGPGIWASWRKLPGVGRRDTPGDRCLLTWVEGINPDAIPASCGTDTGRLSIQTAAIHKPAQELVTHWPPDSGHAVCLAAVERSHSPIQPVRRQDHTRINEGHDLTRGLSDAEIALEVSIMSSRRCQYLLYYEPPVIDTL